MFVSPECSYFSVFGFPVYYYGVILAIAIFIGIVISNNIAMKKYFLFGIIPNISTSVIVGGIVGARLYYCLLNYSLYLKNPLEILALREGGLSIHGAILGGVLVLIYQSKKNNISFLKLCDIFALGLPLAQSIGRWGNFFNSEAFGIPTNLPWKMFVRQPYRPDKYFSNSYFHPTFLYEALLDIVIFIILFKIVLPKYKDDYGKITAWYLILYSIVRFFIEYLRVDCEKFIFGMAVPQIVSVFLIIIAIVFIIMRKKTVN